MRDSFKVDDTACSKAQEPQLRYLLIINYSSGPKLLLVSYYTLFRKLISIVDLVTVDTLFVHVLLWDCVSRDKPV